MVVLVTLTSPGADTGPFNLFSSVDLVTPLVSGVAKSALVSGYTLSSVPDAATYIKVASTGTCTNSINLNVTTPTTTTTTTLVGPTTTTTTTAIPATTTTTTTAAIHYNYAFEITPSGDATMYLNNRPGIPNFTTSYNLDLVNTTTYNLGSDSIVAGAGKTIQKIERFNYAGSVVQTITPGTPNFTFSSFQMVMDSAGVSPGFYQTVKVTIV